MFFSNRQAVSLTFALASTVAPAPSTETMPSMVQQVEDGWSCNYNGPLNGLADPAMNLPALVSELCQQVSYLNSGCKSFTPEGVIGGDFPVGSYLGGGLPTNSLLGGLPTNSLLGGQLTKSRLAGFGSSGPLGALPLGGDPLHAVTSELPIGSVTDGLPNNSLLGGLPTNSRLASLAGAGGPLGSLTSGARPLGSLTGGAGGPLDSLTSGGAGGALDSLTGGAGGAFDSLTSGGDPLNAVTSQLPFASGADPLSAVTSNSPLGDGGNPLNSLTSGLPMPSESDPLGSLAAELPLGAESNPFSGVTSGSPLGDVTGDPLTEIKPVTAGDPLAAIKPVTAGDPEALLSNMPGAVGGIVPGSPLSNSPIATHDDLTLSKSCTDLQCCPPPMIFDSVMKSCHNNIDAVAHVMT